MIQDRWADRKLILPNVVLPWRACAKALTPWVIGVGLFVTNNLGIISCLLDPPSGFQPMLIQRAGDLAQYLTWTGGYQIAPLIPNYHAPWQTEAAYFNLLPWLIAQLATLLNGKVLLAYHLVHLTGYLFAAHALLCAVKVFTYNRAEAFAALLTVLLAVPLLSLAVLPANILRALGVEILPPLPGIGDFIWWSSDGFVHGINGSILVTWGTAFVLAALAALGLYLRTMQRRYLVYACLIAFASAPVHPFEVVVIVGAGGGTLWLIHHRRDWRRAWLEAGALAVSGFAGMLLILVQVATTPWLQEAAAGNEWQRLNPLRLLSVLGLPAILVLVLLLRQPRTRVPTDGLLRNWFLFTLVAMYIPVIRWSQHLLDGFHYIVVLLLVRLAMNNPRLTALRMKHPRMAISVIAVWVVLSVSAYVAYVGTGYADGAQPEPQYTFTAIAPVDEVHLIEWLRRTANPEDLVLAPKQQAPWLATVPMHSFASHFVFSLSYEDQAALSDAFYAGELSNRAAQKLLDDYGVRYVVTYENSAANVYFGDRKPAAMIGTFRVYSLETEGMKPYLAKQGPWQLR